MIPVRQRRLLTKYMCQYLQLDLSVSPEGPAGCRLHLSLAGQGGEALSVALPSTAYSAGLEPIASFKKKKRELTVQVPWADTQVLVTSSQAVGPSLLLLHCCTTQTQDISAGQARQRRLNRATVVRTGCARRWHRRSERGRGFICCSGPGRWS